MSDELAKLRAELDKLDTEMVELLSRRFEVTKKVGALKAREKMATKDPKREEEMFTRLTQFATELNVPPRLVGDILRLILDESVNQHRINN